MKEWMAYFIMATLLYFALYLVVATVIMEIWRSWARRKTNIFLKYNLQYEMRILYPRYAEFVEQYNWLYSVTYVVLWPIMVPMQMVFMTRAIKNSIRRQYVF